MKRSAAIEFVRKEIDAPLSDSSLAIAERIVSALEVNREWDPEGPELPRIGVRWVMDEKIRQYRPVLCLPDSSRDLNHEEARAVVDKLNGATTRTASLLPRLPLKVVVGSLGVLDEDGVRPIAAACRQLSDHGIEWSLSVLAAMADAYNRLQTGELVPLPVATEEMLKLIRERDDLKRTVATLSRRLNAQTDHIRRIASAVDNAPGEEV